MIELLISRFAPNESLVEKWSLQGGISAHTTAFTLTNGKTYVLRTIGDWRQNHNPLAATHEYQLLEQLSKLGIMAPKPCILDQSNHSFVIEFIDGEPNLNPIDLQSHLQQYARHLAAVHKIEHQNLKLDFLPKQKAKTLDQPEVMRLDLDEDKIRAALESVDPIEQSNPPVLRHGDFWPGNLLWKDQKITGIIDWEDARIGEPLADLAIARLDILWVYGIEAMHTLTDLYQSEMNLNLSDLWYWDLHAALRPIDDFERMAPAYPHLGREDVTVESMTEGHKLFVAQALEFHYNL
jgi:aminoglycoside phosphotransferase (APT) family kinase protein